MCRNPGSRGLWSLAAIVGTLASVLTGCGTVLPPLEESDGANPAEDTGAPGEDAADDEGDPPPDDDDAGSDVSLDGPVDVSSDGCAGCSDAKTDGGSRDVSADSRDVDGGVDVADADADARDADGDGSTCPTPVDCMVPGCNGVSCGAHGLVCKSGMCSCPGGQAKETTCGDKADNDCDGLTDCADPDCARAQCGTSTNQRCCGTTCADTETDPANCQGCGLACASGQMCKRISDASGTRGHCTCAGLNTQCPKNPGQVCRSGNGDGQDNLCACDFVNTGNEGCAEGQVCSDVPTANFCHY